MQDDADGVCDLGVVGENVLEEGRNGGPVAEVVMACLAHDPAQRPTPADVCDVLGPVLESLPRGRLGGFKEALAR